MLKNIDNVDMTRTGRSKLNPFSSLTYDTLHVEEGAGLRGNVISFS